MPLSQNDFRSHRQRLMAQMAPNSIALIPAAQASVRSRDTDYPYRQSSDFYYLSGFNEPDALLVLAPGRPEGEFMVFCRPKDKQMEIWEGRMAGLEGACETYGADEAFAIDEAKAALPKLLNGCAQVYYSMGYDSAFDQQVIQWLGAVKKNVRSGASAPDVLSNLDQLLHEQRLIKSESELAVMRESCALAAKAHLRAMQACQPGMMEYQLESELNYTFAQGGAPAVAYNSIVGGGDNACILHYTENNQILNSGDLVLIDAGCEKDMYASDITRTFPVSGTFSEPQAQLYRLTLEAQQAAMEKIKPGNRWNEPHDASVSVLTKGLVSLGLLEGDVQTLIEEGAYKRFYMHRVGHWLGVDVHDVGAYKVNGEWRPLEVGMAMTVEPGLYVAPDDQTVDPRWRGIGIRIEDDVVVTQDGCEVMTNGVPKTIEDIEALMQSA